MCRIRPSFTAHGAIELALVAVFAAVSLLPAFADAGAEEGRSLAGGAASERRASGASLDRFGERRGSDAGTNGVELGWDIEADVAYLADAPRGSFVNNPAPGETVYLHCDWFVTGSGSPLPYFIRILLDDVSYCTGSATLEEGSYTMSCDAGWRAFSGVHSMRCEVDFTDLRFETDETNNTAERVWGSALDLVAVRGYMRTGENSGAEIDTPGAGTSVYFHLDARLDGTSSSVTSHLRAWLDGDSYCAGTITVRPGSSVFNCPSPWTVTPGDHTLTWQFDDNDRVGEFDELNNVVAKRWNAAAETPTRTPSPTPVGPTRTPSPQPQTPTPTVAAGTPTPTPALATATTTGTTATPTPLVDPVEPTYGPRRAPPEVGDCDHDRRVAIGELVRGVRIALGQATLVLCPEFDADRSFSVSIAELIRAVNVALKGALRGDFLPDVFLRIVPGALLLPEGDDSGVVRVDAFASDGDPVAVDSLDVEWISSEPDLVRVDVDPTDSSTATVTVVDGACNAFVFARLRDEPLIVSSPVNVMRAKLHPDAQLVPDEMVVFPPPNLPEGVDVAGFDFPAYVPPVQAGGEGSFGGFAESEIAAYLEVTDDFEMRYPIILRGPAPAVGQRLVASGGAPIGGIVVDTVERGDFCLLQLEVAAPQELFEDLDFSISAEQLQDDGLLVPVDTSVWEDDSDFVPDTEAVTSGDFEFKVGKFECKPPTGIPAAPSFTQSPAPASSYFGPIWDGNLQIEDFTVERFFFKIGILARAFLRPEIRLTPGIRSAFTCDLQRQFRKRKIFPLGGPMALVLAPYLEGFIPSLSFSLAVNGGPTLRFGMNIGFDYSYWTGASYTAAGGWEALCESWAACSRENQTSEVIFDAESGPQITVEGSVGGFAAADTGIVGLGGFLAVLDALPLGSLLQGAKDSILKTAQVPILRARVGPELATRWHNGRRTAFIEASESAANIIAKADLKLKLDALTKYLRKALNFFGVVSIPVLEFELFHFAEPFRILTEETLTVNGQRYSHGDPPVTVAQGQTVPVVATVGRDFINLTLTDLFLWRISPHQEFPHTGELLLDGDHLATLEAFNDFRLTGSFAATRALCERAAQAGGSLEVKVLAYNRMFSLIPTANYAGSFRFRCTDNMPPVVDAGPDQVIDENQSALLQGSVEDDGLPIPPGVTVATWSGSGPGQVEFADRRELITTATFSRPGIYLITLTADDGELSAQDSLTVTVREMEPTEPPSTPTPVVMPGEVGGTVYDAVTGDPIQGATLQLIDDSGNQVASIVSGGGSYLFENVPAGRYTVRASAPSYTTAELTVTVESGGVATADFFLESGLVVNLLEYRKFGSDRTIRPSDPDFDPEESPILFSGTDPSHPVISWTSALNARTVNIETSAGRLTYKVSGDVSAPVRVGECVGDCTDCRLPACENLWCFCEGNSHMPWCIGNVRVTLVDGESAFVAVCLSLP